MTCENADTTPKTPLRRPVTIPDLEDVLSPFDASDSANSLRITHHPVVNPPAERKRVPFSFNGTSMTGFEGEAVSTALLAEGINILGKHHKDQSALAPFCVNGQCSQCRVMIDGVVRKSCVTPLEEGMRVVSGNTLLSDQVPPPAEKTEVIEVPVLIIGGGPAGVSAAIQLDEVGVECVLIDDKDRIGGKLALQTHKFFGTKQETYAGTRGFTIAEILQADLDKCEHVKVWLESTAVGVFSDGVVGVTRQMGHSKHVYQLIKPKTLLVATGAREKMLVFPGNSLPGIYGAGGFQTLVNRDLTRFARRILIIGGGNVGIITAYQALQAGIEVVAVVEAAPTIGGYKVHADRIKRLGVPILTRHTIVAANDQDSHGVIPLDDQDSESRVRSATIAELDDNWKVKMDTKRTVDVDAVLVAIGLSPVDEFFGKAKEYGLAVFSAGDSNEIAEASAAMLTGRSSALDIAKHLGVDTSSVDSSGWAEKIQVLKSRPGKTHTRVHPPVEAGTIRPYFHCNQEIACNACESSCPDGCIGLQNQSLMGIPMYAVDQGFKNACRGCLKCVSLCPGLAITLVDSRKDADCPTVIMAHELFADSNAASKGTEVSAGMRVQLLSDLGDLVSNPDDAEGLWEVQRVQPAPGAPGTRLVRVKVPKTLAPSVASLRVTSPKQLLSSGVSSVVPLEDTAIVCRCERVTVHELRDAIRTAKEAGIWDQNFVKAITRAGMGACGSKTCRVLLPRIFASEGMPFDRVTPATMRPLFVEVPFSTLATAQAHPVAPAANSHLFSPLRLHVDRTQPVTTNASDIVILGAGAVGLGLALALSKSDDVRTGKKRVTVLDINPGPGQGDVKHAIGGVRGCMSSLAKMHVMQRSLEMFRNWRFETQDDIEWKQGGYLFVAYTPEQEQTLRDLSAVHASYGYDTAFIAPKEVQALVPGIKVAKLLGGLYSPADGSCSPLLFAASAHRVANEAEGVEFIFNTPVAKILVDDEKHVVGVLTANNERYLAPVVVNCLGANANLILPDECQLAMVPDSHEAGITEPVHGGLFSPMVIDNTPSPETGTSSYYFYQNSRGQVVFCATPDPPVKGWATQETSSFLPAVAQRMLTLLPRLGPIHVRRVWRGLYPQSADGNPYVGWDSHINGLAHIVGLSGHGFMMAPGLGEVTARLLLGGTTEQDREILGEFDPARRVDLGVTEKLK
ncbi:FAD-dependent pyridine nucleotide-disulfide oxidoreductase [Carpediemonas membranifera]|uniref:FAD-dependent oxidoreductase domain-containing protein 1 n=1 Tax=Carpediemonas membranifera TaxID=201153 RepID=A0A8J6BZX0_9EUKA|nr:FAD-dependent pyridine nucleotide-disulfide oxidoreductase [Carpediemonas membranifera]|eukprot:KAG9395961.1 FAD-dependent pyridine nucleotide-disulfide oxidoreductase [Carpediemonas membranifera]